jgi:hypothetical protein
MRVAAAIAAALLAAVSGRAAATTGTVFCPDVDAGSRALEYRATSITEDDNRPKRFTHRLHYQHAFNEQ